MYKGRLIIWHQKTFSFNHWRSPPKLMYRNSFLPIKSTRSASHRHCMLLILTWKRLKFQPTLVLFFFFLKLHWKLTFLIEQLRWQETFIICISHVSSKLWPISGRDKTDQNVNFDQFPVEIKQIKMMEVAGLTVFVI